MGTPASPGAHTQHPNVTTIHATQGEVEGRKTEGKPVQSDRSSPFLPLEQTRPNKVYSPLTPMLRAGKCKMPVRPSFSLVQSSYLRRYAMCRTCSAELCICASQPPCLPCASVVCPRSAIVFMNAGWHRETPTELLAVQKRGWVMSVRVNSADNQRMLEIASQLFGRVPYAVSAVHVLGLSHRVGQG